MISGVVDETMAGVEVRSLWPECRVIISGVHDILC